MMLEVGEPPFGHLLSVPVEKGGDLLLRYHLAVYANALPEIVQLGRGVESRPVPRRLQDGGQHVGHGAFAVGACDVDGEVVALGVSHGAAHPRDGFQTALVCGTACSLERNEISVEEIEGLLIGHGFAVCLYRSVFNSAGAGVYSSTRWLLRRNR